MMGVVAMSLVDSSHSYDVSQLESQILNQKVTEIEKFFGELVGLLEIRVSFEESVAVDAPQQEFLSEELLKENRAFEEITFINLDGMETSRNARSKIVNFVHRHVHLAVELDVGLRQHRARDKSSADSCC